MASTKERSIIRYTLGVEELALAFGLMNAREIGRNLLLAIYKDVNPENADIRLSVAGHSLLARGLCTISKNGSPILDAELEQALFPVARFDHFFQFSRVGPVGLFSATIHVQKKAFTAHANQAGVVHTIEYSPAGGLKAYLLNQLPGFGEGGKARKLDASLTPGLLGEALKAAKDQAGVEALFSSRGWPAAEAKWIAGDVVGQKCRATLIRFNAGQDESVKTVREAPKPMLLFLMGPERNWLFRFPSNDDAAKGSVELVDGKAAGEAIASFLG